MWGVSGMSKVVDCQKQLIAKSEEKGFLTFDDIMDLSDTYSLSVSEVDQLSEALEIRGIIIYETAPSGKDTDLFEDYSRIDYDAISMKLFHYHRNLNMLLRLSDNCLHPSMAKYLHLQPRWLQETHLPGNA